MTRKSQRTIRVLVVDDLPEIRQAVCMFLEARHGCEVDEAGDGLAAVDALLHRGPFDVLVTDLVMPEMNGLELTGFVRSNPAFSGLPIVMLTSQGEDADRARAREMGVTVYLTKPFEPSTFDAAVGPLLSLARAAPKRKRSP